MSIRDNFFANQAVGALWDVAVSIKRGNPLPLDSNSVFQSYELLETYASGNLAYPGQVVAVVNETSTQIYYLDQDLNIQTVGSVSATDNKTVEINNNAISLYNFGKYFYKYIPAVPGSETEEAVPAHYEKVEVSEQNPWTTGLQPKVVLENEEYVIGWYEPSPIDNESIQDEILDVQISIEALESQLSSQNGRINNIKDLIGAPSTEGSNATGLYLELDKKADSNDVYNKTEVQTLISQAAHLKRKIFNSLIEAQDFINNNRDTAEQYIYLVLSGLQLNTNKYNEYMVIDGELEQVGNWEINLDDYFTEAELNNYLKNYYNSSQIDSRLAEYVKSSSLTAQYYNKTEIQDSYYSKSAIDTLLSSYVVSEEGKSLIPNDQLNKLKTVSENAEENYIKNTSSEFTVNSEGQLSVNTIDSIKINGLKSALDRKVDITTSMVDGKEVQWSLLSPENKKKLDSLVIAENGDIQISGEVNAENVQGLGSWITSNRSTVNGLYPDNDQNKLKGIEEGAQQNYIKSVQTNQLSVDIEGKLSVKNISSSLITNLSNDFTYDEQSGLKLTNDYVKSNIYKLEIGNLNDLRRDIGSNKQNSTIVDEINSINTRLQWQTL